MFHNVLIFDESCLLVMIENRNKSCTDVENYISSNHSVKWSSLSVDTHLHATLVVSAREIGKVVYTVFISGDISLL